MANYRRGRVNEAVCNEVSQIMRDVKDSRLDGVMITVTGADVTPDLKYAKIYYSCIGEFDAKEVARGLKSASAFVRSQAQYAADAGDHVCFRRVGRARRSYKQNNTEH